MTRQGAKEMMLQGKKVTHSTFESDEYAYMDCIVKLNSGKPFYGSIQMYDIKQVGLNTKKKNKII